jgi:light-regulated signal transduction histidine kinase (bacteriophytochrome)
MNEETKERRKAETAIDHYAAELERSNYELQQFAYVASHDLQEPLRMVTSYLGLLTKRYGDKLDKDANEFVAYATEGAARMQLLIQDLLAYSRVGTQGEPLRPMDCRSVLEQAKKNLTIALQEANGQVIHEPLPEVSGDATQLVQLFQNLLSNALKFRGRNKPLVQIGAVPNDGKWLFSVRDNGIGLNPDHAERIFVIFQRLHTNQEYDGTGIGLAICKRIVERHGGTIWVQSSPGEGATFYFTLPEA